MNGLIRKCLFKFLYLFISGDKILEPLRGKVDFSQIDFSYPSRSDVSIFSGLDLSIPSGTSLAVVGPSGSGKSTLASLLLRFYDPIQGRVSLDDEDIRDLNPSWLRRHVGTVSQVRGHVLYCIALYCIVLYCIVLYCIVLDDIRDLNP